MISVAAAGCGAIGGVAAGSLAAAEVPAARLTGVITRNGPSLPPQLPLTRAVAQSGSFR